MVEAITQESIYEPVADDLEAVIAEIATIADRAPENAPEQADDLDAQLGHVLATPGKRVRPALTLLASRLFGEGRGEMPIKMATAVELLHIATLVHDDTVDHADTRRGHQTASSGVATLPCLSATSSSLPQRCTCATPTTFGSFDDSPRPLLSLPVAS
jgi:hypothetical protein